MQICELRARIDCVLSRFTPEVQKNVLRDFKDDCEFMKNGRLTGLEVAEKWGRFVNLEIKK